jgi:hypothetical protein
MLIKQKQKGANQRDQVDFYHFFLALIGWMGRVRACPRLSPFALLRKGKKGNLDGIKEICQIQM